MSEVADRRDLARRLYERRAYKMAMEELNAVIERLESQNQALQERAEKAEAALRVIFDRDDSGIDLDVGYIDIALYGDQAETIRNALSPTQETDPE